MRAVGLERATVKGSLTNQKGWLEGQSVVKDSLTTALGVKV